MVAPTDPVSSAEPRPDRPEVDRLGRFGDLLALRHAPTGAHCRRVGHLAGGLAGLCGFDPLRARSIGLAASLHDIGKLAIPDAILLKEGPLDGVEQRLVHRHPQLGHDLLATVGSPLFELAALIALRHHERLDGSGYPDGLAGAEVPIVARVVAIADCYEALVAARSYRDPLPGPLAIEVMQKGSGTHLDPILLGLFVDNLETIKPGAGVGGTDPAPEAA